MRAFINGSILGLSENDPNALPKPTIVNGGSSTATTPPKRYLSTCSSSQPCSQSTLTVGDSSSLLSAGVRKNNQKRISGSGGTTGDGSQLSLKLQTNLIQSVKKSLAKTKRQWDRTGFIHVIYVFVLLAYSFLGGVLFMALDGPHADRLLNDYRNRCVDLRESAWTRLIIDCANRSFSQCENLTRDYIDRLDHCFRTTPQVPFNHSTSNYWNSLIYAITVFTTIGYGNIGVLSTEGRVAMILYAMIGIPLFFAFLNDMGQWFHFKFLRIYAWVRKTLLNSRVYIIISDLGRRRRSDSEREKQKDDKHHEKENHDGLIFTFAVAVLILYLVTVCGLFMAMVQGQWTFFQSFYFIYQSISLIGFGDEFPDNPNVVLINIIFIIIGIILLSMCFFILQEWIRGKTYRLSTTVRRSVRRWRHHRPANNGLLDRGRVKSARFTVPLPQLGNGGNDRGWKRRRGKIDENFAVQRLAKVDDCSPVPGRRSFLTVQSFDDGHHERNQSFVPRRPTPGRRDGVNSTDETLITGRNSSPKRPSLTSGIAEAEDSKFLKPEASLASRGARDRRHTFVCLNEIPHSLLDLPKRRISWLDMCDEEERTREKKDHSSEHKHTSLHDRPARFGKFQWIQDDDDDDEDDEDEESDEENQLEAEALLDMESVFIIDDQDGNENLDGVSYCEKDEYL